MPMSPEARAAQGESMKAMHAKKRAEKQAAAADPALQEALARVPFTMKPPQVEVLKSVIEQLTNVGVQPSRILVEVDWNHIPMPEAQQFYAHLKAEFENAGRILNARSMERISGYDCFMCHKHFNGNPGFTDYSYIDPKTGLSPRVDCCGELCVINYHKFRIDMRLAENVKRGAEMRGE